MKRLFIFDVTVFFMLFFLLLFQSMTTSNNQQLQHVRFSVGKIEKGKNINLAINLKMLNNI